MECLCEVRLEELGLFRLEEKRQQGDLLVAFQYLMGFIRKMATAFLIQPTVKVQMSVVF